MCSFGGGDRNRTRVSGRTRFRLARPRLLEGGAVIERSGVNFSHAKGESLPPAASERRPELAVAVVSMTRPDGGSPGSQELSAGDWVFVVRD